MSLEVIYHKVCELFWQAVKQNPADFLTLNLPSTYDLSAQAHCLLDEIIKQNPNIHNIDEPFRNPFYRQARKLQLALINEELFAKVFKLFNETLELDPQVFLATWHSSVTEPNEQLTILLERILACYPLQIDRRTGLPIVQPAFEKQIKIYQQARELESQLVSLLLDTRPMTVMPSMLASEEAEVEFDVENLTLEPAPLGQMPVFFTFPTPQLEQRYFLPTAPISFPYQARADEKLGVIPKVNPAALSKQAWELIKSISDSEALNSTVWAKRRLAEAHRLFSEVKTKTGSLLPINRLYFYVNFCRCHHLLYQQEEKIAHGLLEEAGKIAEQEKNSEYRNIYYIARARFHFIKAMINKNSNKDFAADCLAANKILDEIFVAPLVQENTRLMINLHAANLYHECKAMHKLFSDSKQQSATSAVKSSERIEALTTTLTVVSDVAVEAQAAIPVLVF